MSLGCWWCFFAFMLAHEIDASCNNRTLVTHGVMTSRADLDALPCPWVNMSHLQNGDHVTPSASHPEGGEATPVQSCRCPRLSSWKAPSAGTVGGPGLGACLFIICREGGRSPKGQASKYLRLWINRVPGRHGGRRATAQLLHSPPQEVPFRAGL